MFAIKELFAKLFKKDNKEEEKLEIKQLITSILSEDVLEEFLKRIDENLDNSHTPYRIGDIDFKCAYYVGGSLCFDLIFQQIDWNERRSVIINHLSSPEYHDFLGEFEPVELNTNCLSLVKSIYEKHKEAHSNESDK